MLPLPSVCVIWNLLVKGCRVPIGCGTGERGHPEIRPCVHLRHVRFQVFQLRLWPQSEDPNPPKSKWKLTFRWTVSSLVFLIWSLFRLFFLNMFSLCTNIWFSNWVQCYGNVGFFFLILIRVCSSSYEMCWNICWTAITYLTQLRTKHCVHVLSFMTNLISS